MLRIMSSQIPERKDPCNDVSYTFASYRSVIDIDPNIFAVMTGKGNYRVYFHRSPMWVLFVISGMYLHFPIDSTIRGLIVQNYDAFLFSMQVFGHG